MVDRLKSRVFGALEGTAENRIGHAWGVFITTLILLNVTAVILETEKSLSLRLGAYFALFDFVSVCIFTVEYVLRLWSCISEKRYRNAISGRLRFARTPLAVVNLVAILPFYVPLLIPFDLRFVRAFRLMRIFRLLKAARYSSALNTIGAVMRLKKEELVVALTAVLVLLVFASSAMYLVEHPVQPQVFSSIPAAMWWGVVTLTTVGYGDIYPITAVGKVCAAVIALLSIGLFALPAGILASGFSEVLRATRAKRLRCPHCGREIDDPHLLLCDSTVAEEG